MEMPEHINVDGQRSPDGLVEYWGIATKQFNGRYHCLANVARMLCVVEVTITAQKEQLNGSDTCPNG